MSYPEEIHARAADLGLDPETVVNTTADGETQVLVDVDFQKHVAIRYEPVAADAPDIGHYESIEDNGDTHIKTVVKKRPQCPTCNYVLTTDDDPFHLPGACAVCDETVCPHCGGECAACERTLCPDHVHGHPLEMETLCQRCLDMVEDEIQHSRALARLEKAKEWEQCVLQRQAKRFQHRLQAKRLQLQLLQLKEAGTIAELGARPRQPRPPQDSHDTTHSNTQE